MPTSHYIWNVHPVLGNLAFTYVLVLLALPCAGFLLAYVLCFVKKKRSPSIENGLSSFALLLGIAVLLKIILDVHTIEIRYYGICFASGILIAYLLARQLFRERGIDEAHVNNLVLYLLIGVILGGHVAHLLFYEPGSLVNNPRRILEIGTGLASHGGFVGGVVGLIVYCRRKHIACLPVADCIAVAAPLATSCVRLGNLFNSEILGRPANVPWAMIFPLAEGNPIPRHPVQLYEVAMGVMIFGVLYPLFKRQHDRRAPGFFFLLGVLLYFSLRFFVEFSKDALSSIEGSEKYLTMGQWLSIPIAVTAAVEMFRLRRGVASPK